MNPLILSAWLFAAGDLPPKEPPRETQKQEAVPEEHKIAVVGCSLERGVCAVEISVLAAYVAERVALAKQLEQKCPGPKFKRERDL